MQNRGNPWHEVSAGTPDCVNTSRLPFAYYHPTPTANPQPPSSALKPCSLPRPREKWRRSRTWNFTVDNTEDLEPV